MEIQQAVWITSVHATQFFCLHPLKTACLILFKFNKVIKIYWGDEGKKYANVLSSAKGDHKEQEDTIVHFLL